MATALRTLVLGLLVQAGEPFAPMLHAPLLRRRQACELSAKKPMKAQPRDPYAGKKRDKDGEEKSSKKPNALAAKPKMGFGSTKKSKDVKLEGTAIEDAEMSDFVAWLAENGADTSKVTIASFGGLRGVMALEDIPAGQAIVSIPYELTLNLGSESSDPTSPAVKFLGHFLDSGSLSRRYLNLVPEIESEDCSTPDFFDDAELEMLQCPTVVAETRRRMATLAERYAALGADPGFTLEQLRWATWVVVSRVLTVAGEEPNSQFKVLIPFIDMFNHDTAKGAAQVLSGRAAPGSFMKVVAGPGGVRAGEQVFIQYGGGVIGSERFLQDYGFLDPKGARQTDAGFVEHVLSAGDRAALEATSLEQDRALLREAASEGGSGLSYRARLAVAFRMVLKEFVARKQPPKTRRVVPPSAGP